jgi:hypothetical protein
MTKSLPIDPKLGDALCAAIKRVHGVEVDIILIAAPVGDWSRPAFVTSLDADVMEAVIMQLGEQMQDSKGGERIVRGRRA